jgi:hypothetical protein
LQKQAGRQFFQLLRHSTKQGLGIPLAEFGQEHQRLEVGPQVEKVAGSYLTGHERTLGTGFLRGIEQARHLADTHPMDLVH